MTNIHHPSAYPTVRRATRHAWALAAGVLLFLAVLVVAAGSATAQSTDGVIAYSGVDHNIWRMGADGGNRLQLTQDNLSESPDWTPDGTRIAFTTLRDARVITAAEGVFRLNQIYLMGADGSNAVRLSDGSSDDKFPEVIPGGDRIVFLRSRNWRVQNGTPSHDTEIGSMRLDGSDYRVHGGQVANVQNRIDRYPARISPDGTKIVFVRQSQGKSSLLQVLTVGTGQISSLAVDRDRGTVEGSVEYLWPRFDPQGRIVVLRRSGNDNTLIAVDLTGKTLQNLITGLQYESLAYGFDVNWAGRSVIAARSPELPGGMRPEEIFLYDLATGNASAPLDSGHAPSFVAAVGAPPPTPGPPTATAQPNGPTATPGPTKPLIDTPDPLFYDVWERVDRPVKENIAIRSWIWGPQGRAVQQEPYGDNLRLVQYFDKARMELNPATGADPAFVTNGLLVVEMLSGRVQIGPNQYQTRNPATVQIGGDGTNNPAPSYATLARVSSLAGENKATAALQSSVTRTLNANGTQGSITFPATERIGYFAAETGHNIPDVFFNFLNQTGRVYVRGGYHDGVVLDWVFTVGYPISEPYWTKMSIAGKVQDVMVQAFQRQVLTYIPSYDVPWNVQFGNVGVQYYQWRYGRTP
ncbi:MAG TPA: hypothetical protein VM536_22680 [Chloroflexia bacterium]|nr:hypothetical protein [Chloroflexia bacterium]